MDRLDAMTVFVAAIEHGSLSAAGRALEMPLATVSRKLADLEAHLGTRLLHRSTRRLTLTEAGAAYLGSCKRILDDLAEAERAAAGEYRAPRGTLRITAPLVFGRMHVLPVVDEFLAAYPEVDVELGLNDRSIDLQAEHIDVAARIGPLPDSRMVAIPVGAVRQVVVASPRYLAAHGRPRDRADLGGHDAVSFVSPVSLDPWRFVDGARPRARLTVDTAEAAITAALDGIGLTRVLSYQVAAALADGRLETVLDADAPAPLPVHLLHAARGLLPLKLRAFLDFATPRLRTRLA
jgi:DNA-binding transcriptional LysR family regulator